MAKSIKDKQTDKISRNPIGEKTICFSFRHLTTKDRYNFDYFKNDIRKRHDAYLSFIEKLQELSKQSMNECKGNGKILGSEALGVKAFNSSFKGILTTLTENGLISQDSKLAVFRFGNNNFRLICKESINASNVLFIIGFDFDFSAYPHD